MTRLAVFCCAVLVVSGACSGTAESADDAGTIAATDAGETRSDSGTPTTDAGAITDAGAATDPDAGTTPDAGPAVGPIITAVTATNLTQTSAMISWTLNEPGTGQVDYGTTTAYGQSNTPELSFNYSAHSQPVRGLTAGTLYHYRVKSRNQGGALSVSTDFTFTTAPMVVTSGNLPAKVVGGYFTTWETRNGASLRNVVDNTNYNLIYVAFATGVSAGSGTLQLSIPPGSTSAADFKSQIVYANSRGVKVLVSVGGYFDLGGTNSGYVLDSSQKVDEFMVSMRDFQASWGFNGMDWDLEHGNRPDVAGIVDASRRMKTEFGATWIINSAPGTDLSTWVGPTGVLDTLGPNGWDAVGEQIYDLGLSPADYQTRITTRMTVLANKYGANKVILGNKYRQAQKPRQKSVVYAEKGFEAQAARVAAALPGGASVEALTWKAGAEVVIAAGSSVLEVKR